MKPKDKEKLNKILDQATLPLTALGGSTIFTSFLLKDHQVETLVAGATIYAAGYLSDRISRRSENTPPRSRVEPNLPTVRLDRPQLMDPDANVIDLKRGSGYKIK